jgi:undecaprenyl diphosphate synthase
MEGALPKHVAIIMDGNGRWAQSHGLERIEGHKKGAKSVRAVVEESVRLGIKYLTLFSFSTENWQRSSDEVTGLMSLFRHYLDSELKTLLENGVRLRAIGDLERLPLLVRKALAHDIERTSHEDRLNLTLAVSYGGREEIVAAVQQIADEVKAGKLSPDEVDAETLQSRFWSQDLPDPDLLIRTSGEMRISNFLLWQLAYSEIVVTPTLWPDFDESELRQCLAEYQRRERRFGLTPEQARSVNGTR